MITIDIKSGLIYLLFIALIVLAVFLVVMTAKLIKTLNKADAVLDDLQRISSVAANKTELINSKVDNGVESIARLVKNVRTGEGIASRIVNRAISHRGRKSSAGSDDYIARSKARRARNAVK